MIARWLQAVQSVVRSLAESGPLRPHLRQRISDMDHLLPPSSGEPSSNDVYDFSAPYSADEVSPEAELIKKIAKTKSFERLSDIRFLGALDYCLVTHPNGSQSNARFTRHQHSVGVAALARAYLDLTNHSLKNRLLCVSAAMLHDIGHPPFSHTLEPVFKERFGLEHHIVTENIVRGDGLHGSEIPELLNSVGLDPEDVVKVINGDDAEFDGFFSGPVNFDTIEGILRSRNYLKMQNLGITPFKVMEAATKRDSQRSQEVVDNFWSCKDDMYNLVIRSKMGVLFDSLFQEVARDISDKFERSDFFLTEMQIFKKYPEFRDATKRDLWFKMAEALLPVEVPFQVRHFYVDDSVSFFSRKDVYRYRQSKRASLLTLRDILPA
jgi:hypothetical protein